jgi:hypothetical protein
MIPRRADWNRLCAVFGAELLHDVLDVDFHLLLGDRQQLADVPVPIASDDPPQEARSTRRRTAANGGNAEGIDRFDEKVIDGQERGDQGEKRRSGLRITSGDGDASTNSRSARPRKLWRFRRRDTPSAAETEKTARPYP